MNGTFRFVDDGESKERVIVLKQEGSTQSSGIQGILDNYVSEALRKALEKKDDKKDEDKDKRKPKTYSKAEVLCWSMLLMFSAPWTGLWILNALDSAKAQWVHILVNAVPK